MSSYRPFAPHHFGLIFRQDPTTKALVAPPWAGDECSSISIPVPGTVTEHPIQNSPEYGFDGRLPGARVLNATVTVHLNSRPWHPRILDWIGPGKIDKAITELRQIVEAGQPVAVLFRGANLIRNVVIESMDPQYSDETYSCVVSLVMKPVRIVNLLQVPLEQDEDLLALGSQQSLTIGTI